ncbi:hypothetical protein E2562_021422 [Oryza meyeriana var. granulata]|uniref:TF-B3 domain-containing protein n=1 Tax=Oryza meyeriana var. granulata TaxID=110450 RepID=A0A6G1EXS2_9ORYZ|nr:hypothetical protein E2562_021422 [Oryza meyeriana var. granulata]KAF0929401.1 hypothetical protein E2562_021422 [Oryza meyeriana var. granulata]
MVFERMDGAVRAGRLRSCDKVKRKNQNYSDDMRNDSDEEKKKKKKKKKCSDDMKKNARNGAEEEKKYGGDMKKNVRNDASKEKETSNSDKKKNRKAGSDAEHREKKNGNKKAKNRKVRSAFFEKLRKKKMLGMSNQNDERKKSDHDCDKKKTVPLSVSKNKVEKDETNKRTLPNTPAAKERKMRPSDSVDMKIKKKKQDASFVHPEERLSQTFSTNNKEKKRKPPSTSLKREQKMQKASSDDKKETRMTHIVAKGNEKRIYSDGKKKKRKAPSAFFKFMCNKFKELLFIPPAVTPSFEDLINHHVYLEDSEGKSSKIRLSVVDGSVAFYEGWNNFVSEHFIKWGDFLLFEYTAESTFSVRVFGTDSCERLHFNVDSGSKGAMKKRKERHTLSDDLVSHYNGQDSEDICDGPHVPSDAPRSKEPKITVDTEISPSNLVAKSINAASETEDPESVESGVGHESLGPLDSKDRNLSNGECKTRSDSVLCIQEKTRRSEVIIIIDEASSTQENEDTMKQRTSSEASETHHVTINTQKDPERVADGVLCESSVALNNKMGNLILGECKNKNVSRTCSTEKTNGSEIIPTTDASPLAHENIDTVKLNTFSHLEDKSTREPELAAATPTTLEIHDSDEDLRQKHQRNTFQVKSTIAMDKYPNNSKMNISGNVSRIYEAPGGTRCLEKWKKVTVSSRAALDDIGQVRPEKTQKAGEKLVGNCGAMGQNPVDLRLESDFTDTCLKPMLNIPIEQPLILDSVSVSKCGHSWAEVNNFVNRKGATVQLQTKKEPMKPTSSSGSRQGDKIPACVNRVLAHQSGELT